ncbi:MAG: hypothetical protein V7742_17255 [Halioglobus sp.]
MKGLFLAAAILVLSFAAGVVYIAVSESPESSLEYRCRTQALSTTGRTDVSYVEFTAWINDVQAQAGASPHRSTIEGYRQCLGKTAP